MDYRDFISKFGTTSLKKAVHQVAIDFLLMEPYWFNDWIQERIKEGYLEGSSEYPLVDRFIKFAEEDRAYFTVHKALTGSQSDLANWLIDTLNDFNDAIVKAMLVKKTYQLPQFQSMKYSDALRPMIILISLPEDEIKTVSLLCNVDITSTTGSGFLGGFFRIGPDWTLLKKVAEQIEIPPEDRVHPKPISAESNEPSQPVKPNLENVIQVAPVQAGYSNNSADIFHYIGFAVLGFFATGLIAFIFTAGVPGLTGVASILGTVGAVFLTKMYKNSQQGQPAPPPVAPIIQPPPQVVTPPEPPPDDNGTSAICPECGDTSPEEATHCISCGSKLPEIICPTCQTENISRAKFCMGCGVKR